MFNMYKALGSIPSTTQTRQPTNQPGCWPSQAGSITQINSCSPQYSIREVPHFTEQENKAKESEQLTQGHKWQMVSTQPGTSGLGPSTVQQTTLGTLYSPLPGSISYSKGLGYDMEDGPSSLPEVSKYSFHELGGLHCNFRR